MGMPWLKFGEELLSEINWIGLVQGKRDGGCVSRKQTLFEILALSLRWDCNIPHPDNIPYLLGVKPKMVEKVCQMAIERGIIKVMPDGSYSLEWLIEKGFVGCDPKYKRRREFKPKEKEGGANPPKEYSKLFN